MEKPKLAVEKVFDKFRDVAAAIFAEVGEPRALALVVDWEIGQTDFPAGLLIAREQDAPPEIFLYVSNQLNKMNMRVLELHAGALEEYSEVGGNVDEEIQKKQALLSELQMEIEKLEQRKQSLEGVAAPGITDSA